MHLPLVHGQLKTDCVYVCLLAALVMEGAILEFKFVLFIVYIYEKELILFLSLLIRQRDLSNMTSSSQ